jgi:ElaB/YqjD/DUF883 family membrane-anchored ribosome-binding protein
MTETARLERETEETRAQLESTLFELRARMSPSSLMDQATDYLRSSSGRAFVGNLRNQVVDNPLPVTLIGAGIAWLAMSGAMGRRGNGNGRAHMRGGMERAGMERDWGRTGATAYDMAHDGGLRSAVQQAREAAEGWTEDARSATSAAADTMREGVDDLRARAGTMYDETMGRTRQAAEGWADDARGWTDDARQAAYDAGDTLREGVDTMRDRAGELGARASRTIQEGADAIRDRADDMRERASGMYDETVRGTRRMARRAAEYGRAARHAVQSDGALMNFCREQPMLVAGIGIAVGAALGALIPASRTEARMMGEASREVRHRVREAATEGMHAGMRSAAKTVEETLNEDGGAQQTRRPDGSAGDGRANGGEADRASNDIDKAVEQAGRSSNVESEPQSAAPYAETAEAGAASAPGTTETRQPG